MDPQATVFATKGTYLYYTRYYAMLNKMDEIRRSTKRANGSMYFGPVNTALGVGAIAGMFYALRLLK